MQTHGIVTRPYEFETPIVGLYRLYSRLHYALLPYIVEQARISCETGLPLMRHLHLAYPMDPRCAQIEDQFLFGNALLVAPMLERGNTRKLYLPEGTWEALASTERYEGPRDLADYPAPLESIPVFVRKDAHSPALARIADRLQELLPTPEGAPT
jgi:alpha-glucosidase (family GH31 glycosyl hydrolase)